LTAALAGVAAPSRTGRAEPSDARSIATGAAQSGHLVAVCLAVAALATAWALVALPARATYGARTTADEPQYLLSALSLWEDRNLDIADELAAERWRDFHGARLPVQTEPLADGREISPHDPLLPVLLAVPVGLAGWAGAKAALAVLAGALAALLVWVAHRRFAVPVRSAGVVVAAFALCAPLSAYGTQIYPELPAALAATVAVAAATGPLDRRGRWAFGLAVVALPWLAVKYVPVAAALAAVVVWRVARRSDPAPDGASHDAGRLVAGLAAAGVVYVVAHRVLYGGWTAYAAGDHFVGGEQTAIGHQADFAGRSRRLLGLLVDRGFGLAAWAPVWLLAVPALAALARRRPPGWALLTAPLAAGWATATWLALTMHGWWWPGRQVVVVAPLAVLVVAWWSAQVPRVVAAVAALGAVGVVLWGWLVAEVLAGDLGLIIDFEATADPIARAWRAVLPEMRSPTAGDWLRYAGWALALAAASLVGWRSATSAQRTAPFDPRSHTQETQIHVHA
jgi:hypothetical protein